MKKIIFITFIICAFTLKVSAQIVISKPTLGFTQACASSSFNTYNVTFSFSPDTALTGSNQFMVELSDETGDFTNATIVFTSSAGSVTSSPATLSFSLPTTTAGEAFKVRIKSTSPAASSTGSDAFAAYYKIQDSQFTINNLIETAVFCSGGSYLLTIDNPGDAMNDSPLQYPSLTFNWYKETGPSTFVFVETGENLLVSEPGTYFVETNYGSCTSDSYSNRVTVSEASSGETTTSISSLLGNPYCYEDGPTTLSTISGDSYEWFKDGERISGATSQMLEVNESGVYSVNIDLGDCVASASIDLESTGFTSSIDVEDINMLEEGETLIASVTTSANTPTFKWYLNGTEISGATLSNYEISTSGNYMVTISQTVGCSSSKEYSFRVTEPFPNVSKIPNLISPNGDGVNDTWVIPQEYVSGSGSQVMVVSEQGKIVLNTNDYKNNWPENTSFKDVNPVYYYIITTPNNKTRKGSITLVK
ncbi:T9SS type B sorting domain-containing protein [Seonamhaeicola maritimus]|uniref:Gliding motility-associated C-terminal domain-containing protein n=1 Tax=Seonamhaeicola maritimus TaxID=2591822 RepID=A0A5C7GFB5_9FLAO|nr:gliding motility-associated C-terminal domain-containing protein [Seonamhaeicola maritimus]TXG35965.1 gliding motility-associated C-terminal domain-containing protein [Seonamhaeicola maritimus]